ncbi:hypothetical protein AB0D32_31455 [Micromonospora sp. NPDC048170]|uniref:hypothetical protein n=1 Tax=Micromonospora sp. NPDC048170 TaxID=3154819 RepID=UPI0033E6D212
MPRTGLLRADARPVRHPDRVRRFAAERVTNAALAARTARLAGHLADLGGWPADRAVVLRDAALHPIFLATGADGPWC